MKSEFEQLNKNIDNILGTNNEEEIKKPVKLTEENLKEFNKQNENENNIKKKEQQ